MVASVPVDTMRTCSIAPGIAALMRLMTSSASSASGALAAPKEMCIRDRFLRAQIEAGASAVQLFDSWAGSLGEGDYRRYVQQHSAETLDAVREYGVPRIHFCLLYTSRCV